MAVTITAVSDEAALPVGDQDPPHLAYPFTLTKNGALTNGQDTTDDLVACVQAIVDCPVGWRIDYPDFGVTDLTFDTYPLPIAKLGTEIRALETRPQIDLSQTFASYDPSVATVTIQVQALS